MSVERVNRATRESNWMPGWILPGKAERPFPIYQTDHFEHPPGYTLVAEADTFEEAVEWVLANYKIREKGGSFTTMDIAGSDGLTIRSFSLDDGSRL